MSELEYEGFLESTFFLECHKSFFGGSNGSFSSYSFLRLLRIAPRALETWVNGPTRWKHRGVALNTKRAVSGICLVLIEQRL